MSWLCGRLLRQATPLVPTVGQVRFRRINPVKPHRPDWFRQKLLAVSKPVWEDDNRLEDLPDSCNLSARMAEAEMWNKHLNQLEMFYVQELREAMESSQMVAFFHTNPIANCNFRKAWQNGRRARMELKRFNKRVGMNCFEGTEWENCLQFWMNFPGDFHEQPILFSPEVKPKQLLAFEKKVPEFHLLGCVVYGRILSRAQLGALVNMPDLQYQREQLVGLLGSSQRATTDLLGASQRQLARNLDQLLKDGESS